MRHVALPVDPRAPLSRDGAFTLLDWILDTHLEDAVPGFAGLDIGPTQAHYDARAAELEGLTRLLWGADFAFGAPGEPRSADKLLSGIANGANPEHPSYWGRVTDINQRAVEMAPIAVLLLENPGIAARIGKAATENLCRWLADIQGIQIHPNNWRFFRILTMKALDRAGWPINRKQLADELDFIDSQYIADGWYGDGASKCRDYYNAFAFHCYGLLYARWFMKEEPERCGRFVERARAFAPSYRRWFDADGANIAYGRSLTYRFAVACFWPLLAQFGHPDMPAGALRGLWSRNLSWWLRQPFFDPLGRMSIGYAYPNMIASDFYNSPQSPLWCMKSFFPLALPAEHPFWTAAPEPDAMADGVHADRTGMFVHQRLGGGAYMLTGAPVTNENRNTADKYGKFAYSSRHGLCVEAVNWIGRGCFGDNILAFSTDGEQWYARRNIRESSLDGDELRTVWSPMEGCVVETRQRFTADGERRTHTVTADRKLRFAATGHAADFWKRILVEYNLPPSGAPAVASKTLFSDIADADGKLNRACVPAAPNTNLLFPQCCVPAISGEVEQGRTVLDTVLRYGKR